MKIVLKMRKFVSKQILDIKSYGIQELFRKFFLLISLTRYLVIITLDIIAILPCLIIRLISPWLIIRIQKLPAESFGSFAAAPALYYCKKKLNIDQPTKKCIDLIYVPYNHQFCNKQLIKMWKRRFNFLSPYLLDPIFRVNKIFPGFKNHEIKILETESDRDINNLLQKCQPILEFTDEEEIEGKKILSKFGLKDKDKFVCFAIRDRAYDLMRVLPRFRDWSYHDYRNNNIDNYILAAEELTKRGYYVFRMGVVVEERFNSNNPKIIDYANSNHRSDFMDIYLGAKCSFCISTQFGALALYELFDKPIAQVSIPLAASHTHNENSLFITQHHILKKEKRKLSLSEIFSHSLAYAFNTKIFKERDVELVENTPEEIKDLALELENYFESKKESTNEDKKLQKIFKDLFVANYKLSNPVKNSNPYWKSHIHGKIRSCYGAKFLRENRDWLK